MVEVSPDSSFPRVVEVPLRFPDNLVQEKPEQPETVNRILPRAILAAVGVLGFLLVGSLFILFTFFPGATKKSPPAFPFANHSVPEQTENKPPVDNSSQSPFDPPWQPSANDPTPQAESKKGPKVVLPRRQASFPTIRFLVNIDEKGITTFHARRSNAIEPFPAIEGTRFPFVALQAGMAICGPKTSANRVVFPQGILAPPIASPRTQFPQPASSFGWKYHFSGQAQSASSFSRFVEGAGIVDPGVMISKRIKLPVTFVYEIIDDSSYHPPHLCITLRQDSNQKASNIRLAGNRHQDGSILFSGWIDGGWPGSMNLSSTRFNNAKLDKTGSFTQRLVIPSEALFGNGFQGNKPDSYRKTVLSLQVHSGAEGTVRNKGRFDLTYLEIAGDFEGSIGVPRRGNVVDHLSLQQIQNALANTIPLSEGATVTGINGKSNPEEIKKILDALKFGEEVTLDITQRKNRSSSTTAQKTVTLFAQ